MKRITTVTHWGTYEVEVENEEISAVHDLKVDTDPSPIGRSLANTLNDACRITTPMVRQGYLEAGYQSNRKGRGAEPFVAVSWIKAEQLVANEISRVKKEYGNQAIFGGSYGWASAGRFHHAQSQLHRFLNCIGGYTDSVNTYSFAAAEVILPHVVGDFWAYAKKQTSWPSIINNTKLILAFGGLPLKNSQVSNGGTGNHVQRNYMQQAKNEGIDFINISPIKDDCADFLNAEWLAARPNTDVAIMLGIAHTLIKENLYDRAFLGKYSVGFDRFHAYLMGADDAQEKNAEWAASISGLNADSIMDMARRAARERTMISLSWSLTRQDHGEQAYWMGVTLAAMLGQIGLPGGGIGFGYAADNTMGNQSGHYKLGSLPQGNNKIKNFIPVARTSDMLLHPGEEFDYNGRRYTYPDIKLVYWAGGNPFHQQQDTNKLLQAWQQPDTIITNEIWWNATARHADIVLPCTAAQERNDLAGAANDPYLFAVHAAVKPHAEARNDFDIYRGIARCLGMEKEFTAEKNEMEWLEELYEVTAEKNNSAALPPFDEFWSTAAEIKLPVPEKAHLILEDFRLDPDKNPLPTPSGKIEIFSETIDNFSYDDCPGHAVWIEPIEWLGSDVSKKYPLHMISNQPKTRLHSQLDNGIISRQSKIKDREPVRIHPDDAKIRNIETGDIVRIFNERGQCLAGVIVDENILPNVIQMATGAWWNPDIPGPDSLCKHGQVNVLTIDKGTSKLAQGPAAMSCLVDIEKYEGDVPAVTIFDTPVIIDNLSNDAQNTSLEN